MTELDEENLDRVDAYHRGELSATEEAELRTRIKQDPDFAGAVLRQEQLLEGLKPTPGEMAEREAFKASFKARQVARRKIEDKQPASVRALPRWIMGVAAVLLLGVIGYVGNLLLSSDNGGSQAEAVPYFTPLNRVAGRMGTSPETKDALATAYAAYDIGDYVRAAPLLQSAPLVATDSLNLLFGAVAELGLGNAGAASGTLEKLRETRFYADYRAEIDFYLALAYLELGERSKGGELLEMVNAVPGTYGNIAGDILEKIFR